MIDQLQETADQVADTIHKHHGKGKGFRAVCTTLGLDADGLNAFVDGESARLNGEASPDGGLMHGVLIGAALAKRVSDEADAAPVVLDSDGDLDWAAIGMLLPRHEVRTRILRHLHKVGVASPNELSKVLGLGLSNVSYHVSVLAGKDKSASPQMKRSPLIKQVRTEPRRGAVEHYYSIAAKARKKEG